MVQKGFEFLLVLTFCLQAAAQFEPQIGSGATKAIHKDSSILKAWAQSCTVSRGWVSSVNKSLGKASFGADADATGPSNGKVVSLGDSGMAVLTFNKPITNGPGPDFVVFENGFLDQASGIAFLELAFVEVSSNGTTFVPFASISNTDTNSQTPSFGHTDASKIHNLAGKYLMNYGTPFDLEELASVPGLDVSAITHVRIRDVVGSIQAQYGTKDSRGIAVNDPFPTPFSSAGFDLESVAVINEWTVNATTKATPEVLSVYPNPITEQHFQLLNQNTDVNILIHNLVGTIMFTGIVSPNQVVQLPAQCSAGMYLVTIQHPDLPIQNSKVYVK